jgi:hypothetical protein
MAGDQEPHGCVTLLAMLFAVIVGIWVMWCCVIAFVGGTMPIIGLEVEGGLCFGLIWLFVISPIVEVIAYWIVFLPLMVLSALVGLSGRGQ